MNLDSVDILHAPELAPLDVLQEALSMSSLALRAVYPGISKSKAPDTFGRREKEAYALVAIRQIEALEATLGYFFESVERLRSIHARPSQNPEEDVPPETELPF